jgi:hypothetical protein
LLVAQQASAVLQWFIKKELKAARAHAYEATIESRGKDQSFWIPYVEEWKVPPIDRAQRSMERKSFLMTAGNPWLKLFLLRGKLIHSMRNVGAERPFPVVLQPLNFIPFLGILVSAGLASV